jgi:tetratricopeptide (TPR) repeat protein
MLIQIGDEAKTQEKFEEAVTDYQKALRYKPNSSEAKSRIDNLGQEIVVANYNHGRNYETQNRLNEALHEYEKAYNIDPSYQDLKDRYQRIKAKIQGNLPACAVLFFRNYSDQLGVEDAFIQALNTEVAITGKDKLAVIDYRKVQAVLKEQANALGDNLSTSVALDIGRILGADQIIIGDINLKGKKDRIEIVAKIYKVNQADRLKEEKTKIKFDSDVELQREILKAAQKLAKKIVD